MKRNHLALTWTLLSAIVLPVPHLAGQAPTNSRSDSMKDAERRAMDEKVAAIAKRGMYDLALLDKPLPHGMRAVIRLNQPGQLERYVIVSAETLDDALIFQSRLLGIAYEARNSDDDSPIEIRLYSTGQVETESAKKGRSSHTATGEGVHPEPQKQTKAIKAKMTTGKKVNIEGYGKATVVALRLH
jgi:hypothetical protein